MNYFLGIDAGGTKTQCVLATETEILTRAQTGSIKILRVSQAEAQKNLEGLLQAVSRASGISLQSISGTCVGLSGYMIAPVANWVRQKLMAQVGGPISICGDEEIALEAAFQGGPGILVIAGTGSNVIGRTNSGQRVHAGGWGPVLSDQGSGNRIGLQALRAIFYAIDSAEETLLLPAVHAAWKTRTIEDLIERGNRIPGEDFSELAPLVAKCADQGDRVARRVLQQAGEDLAALVLQAIRLGDSLQGSTSNNVQSLSSMPWTVAFTGSVVEKVAWVRESIMKAVHDAEPTVVFVPEPVDAALGAVWLARQNNRDRVAAV